MATAAQLVERQVRDPKFQRLLTPGSIPKLAMRPQSTRCGGPA